MRRDAETDGARLNCVLLAQLPFPRLIISPGDFVAKARSTRRAFNMGIRLIPDLKIDDLQAP